MEPLILSLDQRPELAADLYEPFEGAWPEFMCHDPVDALFDPLAEDAYPQYTLVAVDRETGQPVAKGYSVPFTFTGDPDRDLPARGYDAVLLGAATDRLLGRRGTIVAALEVTVRPGYEGNGLATTMLDALRRNAVRFGFGNFVLPVRPTGAHAYPDMPMEKYAAWTREDGLPVDPWLRTHVRSGGRIVGVAPTSMVITGTLDEWRRWTGLPFDTTGPVSVEGALAPVRCDLAAGVAVYVEPNVWVHHKLT
jgi:hypothetical protein